MSAEDAVRLGAALAPVVVVLVLLVLRVKSMWAGCVGLVVALAAAVWMFPVGTAEVSTAVTQLGPTMTEVVFILLGGVALAELMVRGGGQDAIAAWLEESESRSDSTVTLLLLVYGLTPFMESVTGFGLGVVITAPLLIRHGLPPVTAVVVGLLGLVVVPWGSLGPGTLIAAALGGQHLQTLGVWSALLTLPVLVISTGVVLAVTVGRPRIGQVALGALVIAVQWGGLIGANLLVGVPLAGVISSVLVIVAMLVVTRVRAGGLPTPSVAVRRAVVPYAVLVVGILAATGLLALTGAGERLGWVASPAIWVLIAALSAPLALGLPRSTWPASIRAVLRRWVPVVTNAVVFLLIGIVMATAGMAAHLALVAAEAGHGFVLAVPAIGALGGYLTGSNSGAAAMFSTATTTAATTIGASPLVSLAGQNVGGSIAIIASPPRVALAVGVALEPGEELPAAATRTLVGVVIACAAVLGLLLLLLA